MNKTFKQFVEGLTPEQKNAALTARYKELQDPKKPVDPVKELKHKKKGMV